MWFSAFREILMIIGRRLINIFYKWNLSNKNEELEYLPRAIKYFDL